jgi:simple sugar transport system substrate-binding protein
VTRSGTASSPARKAGDDYNVKVEYSSDPDPAKQSQLIDGAVADKVDGIVVSMANPDGLEDSIKKAVAAGVPVVSINSGVDKFKEFGAITHIGQTETIAGEAVGERLKGEGLKKGVCVIQEAGNIGLEERCKAVANTFRSTARTTRPSRPPSRPSCRPTRTSTSC